MFEQLRQISQRPEVFGQYTAEALWTDPHTAQQMLKLHLDENVPLASRTGAFIDRSVDWLRSRFSIGAGTAVADFGCGPGLYASRFARLGAQVTGIDFSAGSIDYARQEAARQGLSIDYRRQNYLDFASGQQYDLIVMIFCDFCALAPQQRRRLLGIFRRHLKEGGALFLDVCSLAAYRQRQAGASYAFDQMDGFWSAEDYYGFLNTFKYEREKVVLDKYTIVEAARTRTIYNWLQYYSLETLRREFAQSGFAIGEVYGDAAGAPYGEGAPEIAVVAGKGG